MGASHKNGTPYSNPDLFWKKVAVRGADDCWLWQGAINKGRTNEGDAYGRVMFGGRANRQMAMAHRVALKHSGIDVPDDAFILHSCDVRLCCNPRHLRVGTHQDNMRDYVERGAAHPERIRRGENHPRAKLTAAAVAEIRTRAAAGANQSSLARKFGVSRSAITFVVNGRHWEIRDQCKLVEEWIGR